MGAEPWSYFVPYQPDVTAAMEMLQLREFSAGRYYSRRTHNPSLPPPASIDDLRENYLDENGSRSILDMTAVADDRAGVSLPAEMTEMFDQMPPELRGAFGGSMPAFCTVVRVPDDELVRAFGTTRPTRAMIEADQSLYQDIQRGCGIYVIAYRDGRPDEIYFAGYSFD